MTRKAEGHGIIKIDLSKKAPQDGITLTQLYSGHCADQYTLSYHITNRVMCLILNLVESETHCHHRILVMSWLGESLG